MTAAQKVGLWALTVAAIVTLALSAIVTTHLVPSCPEDSVLVGQGAFESGRWSEYQCGPAFDDYGG